MVLLLVRLIGQTVVSLQFRIGHAKKLSHLQSSLGRRRRVRASCTSHRIQSTSSLSQTHIDDRSTRHVLERSLLSLLPQLPILRHAHVENESHSARRLARREEGLVDVVLLAFIRLPFPKH